MSHGHGWFDMVLDWEAIKNWISAELHVSHAVLHIHLGLALFLLSSWLFRRSPGSLLPWLFVVALELANEISDFLRYYVSGWPWTATNTIEDIVNTLFWPTVLLIIFRRRTAAVPEGTAAAG